MRRLALLLTMALAACEPSGNTASQSDSDGVGGKADEPAIDCGGDATVCVSPAVIACEGRETETAFDCTDSGDVCGWDFDARRFNCVTAAEQCDRPGETICLTSVDTAGCTEAGLVEPGQPCILSNQACGWDATAYNPATEQYGRMGCVDTPPICGRLDEPCCGASATCGRGLVCFEGTCRESSPGCGTDGEPCCNGSICHEGFECAESYCRESNGNCGREGEGCCLGTICAEGLTCNAGTCAAE